MIHSDLLDHYLCDPDPMIHNAYNEASLVASQHNHSQFYSECPICQLHITIIFGEQLGRQQEVVGRHPFVGSSGCSYTIISHLFYTTGFE